jgi:hypothetical protein
VSQGYTRGRGAGRRAARLGPDERIAPHLTRGGRFARIDPLKAATRPTLPRILGAVGWAILTVESLRRARGMVRGTDQGGRG